MVKAQAVFYAQDVDLQTGLDTVATNANALLASISGVNYSVKVLPVSVQIVIDSADAFQFIITQTVLYTQIW